MDCEELEVWTVEVENYRWVDGYATWLLVSCENIVFNEKLCLGSIFPYSINMTSVRTGKFCAIIAQTS